jgi:hypothetical protein
VVEKLKFFRITLTSKPRGVGIARAERWTAIAKGQPRHYHHPGAEHIARSGIPKKLANGRCGEKARRNDDDDDIDDK